MHVHKHTGFGLLPWEAPVMIAEKRELFFSFLQTHSYSTVTAAYLTRHHVTATHQKHQLVASVPEQLWMVAHVYAGRQAQHGALCTWPWVCHHARATEGLPSPDCG